MDLHYIVNGLLVYACISSVLLIGTLKSGEGNGGISKYFSPQLIFILKLAIGAVFGVPCLYVALNYLGYGPGQNVGQIGDFIGGLLNPLLSFMALIAVLISIKSQQDAQEIQQIAQTKQEGLLAKQLFETSLFNLMEMLRNRRNALPERDFNGQKMPEAEFLVKFFSLQKIEISKKIASDEERHEEAMKILKKLNNIALGTFKRHFALVVDFIEGSNFELDEKKRYYKMVISDLSPDETICLANYLFCFKRYKEVLLRYDLIFVKDEYLVSPKMFPYYRNK